MGLLRCPMRSLADNIQVDSFRSSYFYPITFQNGRQLLKVFFHFAFTRSIIGVGFLLSKILLQIKEISGGNI